MGRMALPPGRFVSDREYLCTCKKCGKEKMYYNVAVKKAFCQRCKTVIIGERQFRKVYDVVEHVVVPSEVGGYEVLPANAVPAYVEDKAKEYLHGRFMSTEDIILSNFYYADNHIYCPIDPLTPELPRSWMRRSIKGKGGWYALKGTSKKNYCFGWGKATTQPVSVLGIVEGVFDAVPNRLGIPTVAILGSYISSTLKYALEVLPLRTIYTAFDPDDAGQCAANDFEKHVERCLGIPVTRIVLPLEMGDYGPKHPVMEYTKSQIALDELVMLSEDLGLYD